MRRAFLLIVCLACLSGCVGVREHWADGFGWMWNRTWSQVGKHGPEFAADAAADATANAATDAIFHESPREREERETEEFFDN